MRFAAFLILISLLSFAIAAQPTIPKIAPESPQSNEDFMREMVQNPRALADDEKRSRFGFLVGIDIAKNAPITKMEILDPNLAIPNIRIETAGSRPTTFDSMLFSRYLGSNIHVGADGAVIYREGSAPQAILWGKLSKNRADDVLVDGGAAEIYFEMKQGITISNGKMVNLATTPLLFIEADKISYIPAATDQDKSRTFAEGKIKFSNLDLQVESKGLLEVVRQGDPCEKSCITIGNTRMSMTIDQTDQKSEPTKLIYEHGTSTIENGLLKFSQAPAQFEILVKAPPSWKSLGMEVLHRYVGGTITTYVGGKDVGRLKWLWQ